MRLAEDSLTTRVKLTLGGAYDASADYLIVRPAMVGLPKYAGCAEAGRFREDTREGTELVILVRPKVAAPQPATSSTRVASAAERVRSAIAAVKPRK